MRNIWGCRCIWADQKRKHLHILRIDSGSVYRDGRRSCCPKLGKKFWLSPWHKPSRVMPCLVLIWQKPYMMISWQWFVASGGHNKIRRIKCISCPKINYAPKRRMVGSVLGDLHLFNLAMLAWQGWRLLTNPESLCAQVLRPKYFPVEIWWMLGRNQVFLTLGAVLFEVCMLLRRG